MLALAMAGGGCGAGVQVGDVSLEQGADTQLNRTGYNRIGYNRIGYNRIGYNRIGYNRIGYNRIGYNRIGYNRIGYNGTLDGTMFVGTWEGKDKKGHHVSFDVSINDLIGAEFPMGTEDEDGPVVVITDIDQGTGANSDVFSYLGVWKDTGEPVCGLDEDGDGQPIRMIPLAGYWDETSGGKTGGDHFADNDYFTFACEGFVLAECAEDMGYKPWKKLDHHKTLADHHQACTRMMRADYCGDGVAYTMDHTLINYWDDLGISLHQYSGYKPSQWVVEAEWDTDGANCLGQQRHPELGAPTCATKLHKVKNCGNDSNFDKGTLLMDEVPTVKNPKLSK